MKTITKLFLTLAFLSLADSALAGIFTTTSIPVDITYETPFRSQFEMVIGEPLKMGVLAPPNRRIIVRVYKLHPSGTRALHQKVLEKEIRMPSVVKYHQYKYVYIKGLEFGTGIRYAVTFEIKNNLYTTAKLRAIASWARSHSCLRPLDTPYPAPRAPSPRVATPVVIEEE
jgi:hypothetical protein